MLAASLRDLLDTNRVSYRVFQHRAIYALHEVAPLLNIDPSTILQAQLLEDADGLVMVVYRLDSKLDFAQLEKILDRNLMVVATTKINRIFKDCDAGCWPPVGQSYGLEVLIDKRIMQHDSVYFSAGSNTTTLQLQLDDYLRINHRAKILAFTQAAAVSAISSKQQLNLPPLPSLPPLVMQILQLALNNQASIDELATMFAQDAVLQQQILLYARQPFMHLNKIKSDNLDQIVLTIAPSRYSGHNTYDLWLHSLYAAVYAEQIARASGRVDLDPAMAYLCGLFHNIGLLLFSQLFPPEYSLLRKWMQTNPKVSIAVLEKRLLGMGMAFNIVRQGHSSFGEALLRHWHMPEPICVVAKEHHSLNYQGEHIEYVKIIQLTNQLLKEEGIGDGSEAKIGPQLLEGLNLHLQPLKEMLQKVKNSEVKIEQMARFLTKT